jgi:hypothetical protein
MSILPRTQTAGEAAHDPELCGLEPRYDCPACRAAGLARDRRRFPPRSPLPLPDQIVARQLRTLADHPAVARQLAFLRRQAGGRA